MVPTKIKLHNCFQQLCSK